MKLNIILYIILSVLLTTSVLATNVTVDSFKVYSNGDNQYVEWDDDDFDAFPGQTLEVQIRFKNDYNTDIDLYVESVLKDIEGDIDRDKDIEINSDDDEVVVFEYYIPPDVREGIYELEVQYEYTYNSTDFDEKKEFDVNIRKTGETIEEILVNITKNLVDEKGRNNDLLEAMIDVASIATNLSTCSAQLADLKSQDLMYDFYQGNYENETKKADRLNQQLSDCKADRNVMYTQNDIDIAKKKGKDEMWSTMFFVALVGFVIWWIMDKKKKVGGKGVGKPITGTWK